MQTRLAILDREIGPGLGVYLMSRPVGLSPVLCENWEELHTAGTQLALVGAAYWQEEQAALEQENGKVLLRLEEGFLMPYQPADALIREIYQRALEQDLYLPGAFPALYEKEVVAVCSPHSYDLQSAFAVIYSLIRGESKRTLYLDFTYYNGFFDGSQEDVGDLCYELCKEQTNLSGALYKMVQTLGALDYIPPVRMQMDLEDMTGEDFTMLLQRLLRESEYELVVLNMPARPSFLRAVYSCCNRMYSLQREGALFERSQARLLEDLRLEGDGEELSNLQVVPVPAISGGFSMDASMYEELLFGEMAAFIRSLL
jgi:hypothetical protein